VFLRKDSGWRGRTALTTGERLLPAVYGRCADRCSIGVCVDVGCFGGFGLDSEGAWGNDRYGIFGLAAARKSRSSQGLVICWGA
jgi:hypothetical protein